MKYINVPKILRPFECSNLIRLGKNNDGGYLVNELDVIKTNHLISFGIGEDISFEKDFSTMAGCSVTGYDGTVGNEHDSFFTDNKTIVRENVGTAIPFFQTLKDNNNIFLKCDIEGGEYKILNEIINNSHLLTGLSIEFHDIYEDRYFNIMSNFISKIGMRLVHTHFNNYGYYFKDLPNGILNGRLYIPNYVELTFTSSNANTKFNPFIQLPHQLDMPNNSDDSDFWITFNE